MRMIRAIAISAAAVLATGCTIIETGEVGVRVGFDKQLHPGELLPGSFNQTIWGSVLTFPVKDVNIKIDNLNPIARDNSVMKDFDLTVVYSINPAQVSELYAQKNRSFHTYEKGDIYLMYNYIQLAARNAVYKAARNYEALEMADARAAMEQKIKELIVETFKEEKLETQLMVSQIMIRSIVPSDAIVSSANELVKSKNELKQKEVEVKTAKMEAERIAALNANKGAVEYMNAMAMMNISEGIKAGKVHTIVVPADFKGMVNVGK